MLTVFNSSQGDTNGPVRMLSYPKGRTEEEKEDLMRKYKKMNSEILAVTPAILENMKKRMLSEGRKC